jgi:hypothetical protein
MSPNYVPPLPRRTTCKDPDCRAEIVFLRNPKTGASIPCDVATVGEQDRQYDPKRHVSHFTTCKRPNNFSASRKVEPQTDAFAEDAGRDRGVDHDDPEIGNK